MIEKPALIDISEQIPESGEEETDGEVRPVLMLWTFRGGHSSPLGNVQTNICILRYQPH